VHILDQSRVTALSDLFGLKLGTRSKTRHFGSIVRCCASRCGILVI
jgi:hypothetical protein